MGAQDGDFHVVGQQNFHVVGQLKRDSLRCMSVTLPLNKVMKNYFLSIVQPIAMLVS